MQQHGICVEIIYVFRLQCILNISSSLWINNWRHSQATYREIVVRIMGTVKLLFHMLPSRTECAAVFKLEGELLMDVDGFVDRVFPFFRLMVAINSLVVEFCTLFQPFDLFISWYGLTNQSARSLFSFKSRNSISCIASLFDTVLLHLDFITARPIWHSITASGLHYC
jgi:hypothetical protein